MRMDGSADGQTGMKDLIVVFHNCVNAPKNGSEIPLKCLDIFFPTLLIRMALMSFAAVAYGCV
jgi:hypothetical protein